MQVADRTLREIGKEKLVVHLAFQIAEDAFSMFADTTLIFYLLVPFLTIAVDCWTPDYFIQWFHRILVGVLVIFSATNPGARIYQLWTGITLSKEDKEIVDGSLNTRAGILMAYRGTTVAYAALYLAGTFSFAVSIWFMVARSRQVGHYRMLTKLLCILLPLVLIVRAIERLIFSIKFIFHGQLPSSGAQLADLTIYAILSIVIYSCVVGLHFSKDLCLGYKSAPKNEEDAQQIYIIGPIG
jgi:hypothetical protein